MKVGAVMPIAEGELSGRTASYAELRGPRMMVYAPNGDLFVSSPSTNSIFVLRDANNDGVFEARGVFADGKTAPAPEPPAPAGPAGNGTLSPPVDTGLGGPAAGSASPTEEAAPLPAAIAGLIGTTPGSPHSGPDRRGVATVALMLMLVDCAGIAVLHRGRPSATVIGRWSPALLARLPRGPVRLRS